MFGHYAGFILASYGVTAATILLLVLWVILEGRAQGKILAELNERGIHRRSERKNLAKQSQPAGILIKMTEMNTAPQDKEKQNEPAAEGPEAEGPEAEGPEAEGEASTLPKRRFNIFILLPLLIFIGMAGLFGYQMKFGSNPHDVPSVLINKAAPDFDLAALDASFGIRRPDGGIIPGFKTADFSGKVSVVNVWASWCPTCRDEHPLLIELTNDDRFDLIGLAYKDEPANSARFLKNHGNPFDKIGMDISGRVGIDWGVYGAPETFIVDNKGIIRYKHIGALTKRSLEDSFLPKLEEILAEAN